MAVTVAVEVPFASLTLTALGERSCWSPTVDGDEAAAAATTAAAYWKKLMRAAGLMQLLGPVGAVGVDG